PLYFNSAGNVNLASIPATTGGASLAIAASQNVTISGGTLSTQNAGGAGGDLLIVAGANITPIPASPTQGSPAPNTTVIDING
ncbi:hypothetical protein ABTF08_20815, partial [Acinetobacter baumannii]